MFAAERRWQGVWHLFIFLAWDLSMQPRTHIWISTNLYALEHVPIVQIWIIHMNVEKSQLMYKNVQANPEKSLKLTQHSFCSMLTLGKKLKLRRGNGYRFFPKGVMFPSETITLVVRSSGLWEAYTQTCHKWDKFSNGMLMPLHDSMPSFMNFRRVLDLLDFKN